MTNEDRCKAAFERRLGKSPTPLVYSEHEQFGRMISRVDDPATGSWIEFRIHSDARKRIEQLAEFDGLGAPARSQAGGRAA